MKSKSILFFVVVFAIGCASAWAQTAQGRMSGRVTDSTGAVVVGASVTIDNTAKGVKRTVQSNGAGDYVVPNLDPGTYSLVVESPNFHSNFASPSGDLVSRHMGELRDTPDVSAANPVVGSGGSRHIQLGAKVIW